MKKLITAFAACAMAGLVSAEVSSQNIVGYQTVAAAGTYSSSGPTFISVGSATQEWKLGDVTLNGAVPGDDVIQFLNPATAETEVTATYVDAATAASWELPEMEGWWDFSMENSLNDQPLPAGAAFLGNFASTGVMMTFPNPVP